MRIFGLTAIGLAFGLSIQSNVLFAKGESQKVKENIDNLLKTNSCVSCDLEGADFTRMELVKANLENANLKKAKFQLADLSNCSLKNANLEGANFGGADLSNCDLQGAIYGDKTLSGAYLAGVNYATTQDSTEPQQEVKKIDVPQNIQTSSDGKHPVEMKQSKPVPVVEKVQIAERRDFEETPPNIVTAKAVSEKEEKVENIPVSKNVKSDDSPKITTKSVKPFQDVVIEKSSEEVTPVANNIENTEKNIKKVEVVEETGLFEEAVDLPKEEMIVEQNIEPEKEELKQDTKEVENEKAKVSAVTAQQAPKQVVEKTVVSEEEVVVDVEKIALLEKLKGKKECFKCDLSGLDLSGKKFSKVDLEGSDLSNCNLEKTNFSNSNLKGVNFSGANLKEANFKKADLYKAVFTGADLTGAKLTQALIDDAQITDAVGIQINSVMLDGGN